MADVPSDSVAPHPARADDDVAVANAAPRARGLLALWRLWRQARRAEVEAAEALIRREEERLGMRRCWWYLAGGSSTQLFFRTVSAIHWAATVDRRTGAVTIDAEA
jgi:hypothetical protein